MRKFLPTLLLLGLPSCAMMGPHSTPGYVVFFTAHSAELDPPAVGVIAQAAQAAKAAPGSAVRVIGYTDSVGIPQDDVILSQHRAQRVADALVADGVDPGRISRQGRGQTHEDPGVESRRVEIEIAN